MTDDSFDFIKHPNNAANWLVDWWTWFILLQFVASRYPLFGWRHVVDVTLLSFAWTGCYSIMTCGFKNFPKSRFWLWLAGNGEYNEKRQMIAGGVWLLLVIFSLDIMYSVPFSHCFP